MKTLFVSLLLLSAHHASACQPPPPNAIFIRSVNEILKDPVILKMMRSYQITGVHESENGTFAVLAGNCALNVDVTISFGNGPCGGPPAFKVKPIGQVTCLP